MKLFTVGPVACRSEILEEMNSQMFSHRSEKYRELQRETIERLQNFLETEGRVFLYPSSGSGAMESSLRSCVEDKILCCVNGAFGDRYAEMAEANGLKVETLETEYGVPTTPEKLEEKLSSSPDVEAVTITFNDTSVGLLNPLPELAEVVKDHDKLLFVDAVSAMGGTEIKIDEWNLDFCFASVQKCFGVPPGLTVVSASERALEKSKQIGEKGWYFDLKRYKEYDDKKSGTHMTPPIPQILALNKRLQMIEEKGKDKQFEMYKKRSQLISDGIKDLGLSYFPEKGYESPTLSCINAPEHINGFEIYKEMQNKGYELAKGYGDLEKATFRIGNMGHIPFENIKSMLETLEKVLAK